MFILWFWATKIHNRNKLLCQGQVWGGLYIYHLTVNERVRGRGKEKEFVFVCLCVNTSV